MKIPTLRLKPAMMRAIFFVLALFLFVNSGLAAPLPADRRNLTVHFIDVGQGDAVLVLCDDEVMMIDGGTSGKSDLIYSYLKNTVHVNHIDYMIASHPHSDHIGGLAGALNACTVGTLYSPTADYDTKVFKNLLKYAQLQDVGITIPELGDSFSVGGATVTFLSTGQAYSDVNEMSLVVRLDYGDVSFLFVGDAGWSAEHDMVESGLPLSATVLKVGHHGSDTSTSYVFLREVMPEYAVVSVGKNNRYKHPSEATLSKLRDAGTRTFRTDQCGTIICVTDGQVMQFSVAKAVARMRTSSIPQKY